MIKKYLLILLLLMMPGSVVWASLIQIQGMGFTADNTVGRGGGMGFGGGSQAVGSNIINVSNNNRTVDMFGPTLALQDENATLVQTGRAAGIGGSSQTGQTASMIGLQGQAAANRGSLGAQGQILNANLGNTGNQRGGIGGAVGTQYFTGTQNQSLFLPGQTTYNTQTVEIMQYSNVSGSSPGTNASVNSNADVTAGQGQIVLRGSIF
jgi:hypothetical protein